MPERSMDRSSCSMNTSCTAPEGTPTGSPGCQGEAASASAGPAVRTVAAQAAATERKASLTRRMLGLRHQLCAFGRGLGDDDGCMRYRRGYPPVHQRPGQVVGARLNVRRDLELHLERHAGACRDVPGRPAVELIRAHRFLVEQELVVVRARQEAVAALTRVRYRDVVDERGAALHRR